MNFVEQVTCCVPERSGLVRGTRPQPDYSPGSDSLNLCVCVAPQTQVTLHRFEKRKCSHLWVRCVSKQVVQRKFHCFGSAIRCSSLENLARQARQSF